MVIFKIKLIFVFINLLYNHCIRITNNCTHFAPQSFICVGNKSVKYTNFNKNKNGYKKIALIVESINKSTNYFVVPCG